MRIGAHIRTRGGLITAIEGARFRGAEAAQAFASNARMWRGPSPDRIAEFGRAWAEAAIGPMYFHAPYLVNIASPNPEFHRKSIELASATLDAAESIGAAGVVVHAGAGGPGEPAEALSRAAEALDRIAEHVRSSRLIVELMSGSSGAVASTFAEAARLFSACSNVDRLHLCVDTCHLFAAGYNLATAEGVASCFQQMRTEGLEERLVLVHANDAAFARNSRRDRHANVGRGEIGLDGFRAVLHDPAVRRCDVLCETPGLPEDQRDDIAALRSLAGPAE